MVCVCVCESILSSHLLMTLSEAGGGACAHMSDWHRGRRGGGGGSTVVVRDWTMTPGLSL